MAENLTEAKSEMVKMEVDEIINNKDGRQESSSTKMSEGKTKNKTEFLLSFTTINHHKMSTTIEDDEKQPKTINMIAPSASEEPIAQPLIWKQIEEVPIKDSLVTIPKEIATGIYQWNWADVEKFTSQASEQQLTKRARMIPHAILYPIMNKIRPFDDVEVGFGLNANSVTLMMQHEGEKDFYQCPA